MSAQRGAYMTRSRADAIERRLDQLQAEWERRFGEIESQIADVRGFTVDALRAQAGAAVDALRRALNGREGGPDA